MFQDATSKDANFFKQLSKAALDPSHPLNHFVKQYEWAFNITLLQRQAQQITILATPPDNKTTPLVSIFLLMLAFYLTHTTGPSVPLASLGRQPNFLNFVKGEDLHIRKTREALETMNILSVVHRLYGKYHLHAAQSASSMLGAASIPLALTPTYLNLVAQKKINALPPKWKPSTEYWKWRGIQALKNCIQPSQKAEQSRMNFNLLEKAE